MNNKSIVSWVGLVVGLVSLVLAVGALNKAPAAGQSQSLGGVYNNNNVAPGFAAGADFGPLPVTINWAGGKIGPGQNFAYWRNTTGVTQYVDYAEVSTDGGSAAAYKIYAYATTTATTNPVLTSTIFNYSLNGNAVTQAASTTLLIAGFQFATSSAATTTSSDDSKGGVGGAGPQAGGTAAIPNNGYFIILLNQFGGTTATSSVRGFNLPWRIHYHS